MEKITIDSALLARLVIQLTGPANVDHSGVISLWKGHCHDIGNSFISPLSPQQTKYVRHGSHFRTGTTYTAFPSTIAVHHVNVNPKHHRPPSHAHIQNDRQFGRQCMSQSKNILHIMACSHHFMIILPMAYALDAMQHCFDTDTLLELQQTYNKQQCLSWNQLY